MISIELYFLAVLVSVLAEPIVLSSSGQYTGQQVATYDQVPYYLFRGIKFAHVVQRFQEAAPVADSNQQFNAIEFGPACYQNTTDNYTFTSMSEDCLYLNVYSPDLNGSLPVIVFIYGGSFFEGATQLYSGEYFMESKRVVAVTISYRVGAFGFLYLGDDNYPANLGIRDQILGLKWVQKNIKYFGGDPNRVTVNGQSAGGASIDILMHSPLAEGLFIGAISESGTSCSRWSLQPRCTGLQRRNFLAINTGCEWSIPFFGFSADDLVDCLRSKSAVEILNATQNFLVYLRLVPFQPVVEPTTAVNPVITKFPWQDNATNLVPWITGVNSNEAFAIIESIPSAHNIFIRYTANFPFSVTESLKFHYFDLLLDNILEFTNQVVNEGFFYYPMVRCLRQVKSPTYAYYFNYTQPKNRGAGVPHTKELMYTWDLELNIRLTGSKDLEFSKNFVNTWIDFAYYQTTNFSGVIWDRYNRTEDNVLIINNDEVKMGLNPNSGNNSFWETLDIDTEPKTDFCIFH